MTDALRLLLMYGVLPLWVLAGLADWWCHRRSSIESNSGLPESIFHLVMFAQMGVGGVAVLLLEVDAAVLCLLAGLFLLHEASVWLELRFVAPRREIVPAEQMIHSFMELLPLAALMLLCALHHEQFGRPEWALEWKRQPLPVGYLVATFGAIVLFNLLPLLEEAHRCRRGSP